MALISTLDIAGTTHSSRQLTAVPYRVGKVIDFAKALTAKGSALAATDVIEALNIPAGTQVLAAGAKVVTAADSTTLTVDVGTGADADEWVDGFDAKSTAGTYSADLDAVPNRNTYGTADTIDVTLATLTGTLTSGKLWVWALFLDLNEKPVATPGLAALGS